MAQMLRNDSAGVISSLQMDYGDTDEEENSGSRNNSIDSKDDILKVEDMEVDDDEDDQHNAGPNTESDVKQKHEQGGDDNSQEEFKKVEEDEIKTQNSADSSRSDVAEENLLPLVVGGLSRELNPEPLPFTQKVLINAAPLVDDDVNEDAKSNLDEVISDDEDAIHHKKLVQEDKAFALSELVSKESPTSQTSQKKVTRLVSYGPDEDFDEDASDSDSEVEVSPEESHENSPALSDPSALSRSVQNMSGDDIKIPPEPPGNCSRLLQNKIEDMYDRMRREGLDLNKVIQKKKSFRNPSIYEKLIDFCNIDQKGTNFPPEIYDPHLWGKESFYDELDKTQRKDMERREKDKRDKTKIEFVVGTKKSSSDGSSYPDEKKRKTKWDTQPPSGVAKAPSVQGPGVVNLTATATGTKATVISAVGSLSKKSSK